MARTTRLNVMVDEKVKVTLSEYADSMGITLSALCAFVLGDFVRREERLLAPMMDAAGMAMLEYMQEAARRDSPEAKASLDMEQAKP